MLNLMLTSGPDINVADKLIPNLWNFLMQFFAFLVLIVCVIFFAYKPIARYIQKRNDYINGKLNDSIKRDIESKELNEIAQQNVKDSQKKAIEIVQKAKSDAATIKEEENKKLNEQLREKRIAFENELQYEKKQAIVESTKEIANLAIDLSSQILQRNVKKEDEDKMIDSLIEDLEKDS